MSKKTSQSTKKTKALSPRKEAARETTSPERLRILAEQDIALARIVAKNPAAPPNLLKELASTGDKAVRQNVVANPNTPSDVLLELGGLFPENLLNNPVFDLLLLENPNLLADMPKSSLKSLLKRDFVPASFLAWACKQEDEDLLLAVATNPETSRELLEKLTNVPYEEVQQAAKLHVNWAGEITEGWESIAQEEINRGRLKVVEEYQPYELLLYQRGLITGEKLNVSTDYYVRKEMASNPNTPVTLLEKLALDQYEDVRSDVASNPNTPVILLEKLATDVDKDVRQKVVNRITQSSKEILESFSIAPILEQFCKSSQPSFHRLLAFLHPEAPVAALAKYFRSLAWIERYAIAQNPSTPNRTLTYLAKDANRVVRAAAKANQEQRAQDLLLAST